MSVSLSLNLGGRLKRADRLTGHLRIAHTMPAAQVPASLEEFAPAVVPNYEVNWHHRVWFEALDRFIRGDTRRLMVFAPPRHGKSLIVSVLLPAYVLGLDPQTRVIACSHTASLAGRHNREVQRLLESPAYAAAFPDTRLPARGTGYVRTSDLFEIERSRGYYRSAGVGGAITGLGFDLGIIDDPIKDQEQAISSVMREKVWEWYTSTFYTRQSRTGRILVTLTRWHCDDLAGRLLKLAKDDPRADQWEVISFPALREDSAANSASDPRAVGEALWPSWFDAAYLERTRAGLGSYQFAALYQQRPVPLGGGLFKAAWFVPRYENRGDSWLGEDGTVYLPRRCRRFAVLDPATGRKATAGDASALGAFAATPDGRLLILEMTRERVPLEELPARLEALCRKWGCDYAAVEANGFQVTVAREAMRRGLAVKELQPEGKSKLVRALPAMVRAEAGQIALPDPEPEWVAAFLDELANWTGQDGEADDQVDVLSYAVREAWGEAMPHAEWTGPRETQ